MDAKEFWKNIYNEVDKEFTSFEKNSKREIEYINSNISHIPEEWKELCSTEQGYVLFLILTEAFCMTKNSPLSQTIEKYSKTLKLSEKTQFWIERMLYVNHLITTGNYANRIGIKKLTAMKGGSIADLNNYISELQKQIDNLFSDIEEQRVTIRQQAKIIADDMNNDRLTTVPQFYNIVDKERDWKGKKAPKETMIRKTQEALSNKQCFSMFKSKKEGRYYRIEDIVDAAISLEYVRQEYKWSVIEEMKYKDNSRTKTDLDSEGFETSERNGSGI